MNRRQPSYVILSCLLLNCIYITSSCAKTEKAKDIPSSEDQQGEVCEEKGRNCGGGKANWKPFEVSGKNKWIGFDKLAQNYAKWHHQALFNENIPCNEKQILAFTPNAGLGDSVGALTTAYLYALRSGRLFFIDWQPFAWSLAFQELPFFYDYRKALETRSTSNTPLICPDEHDESSFLSGHITAQHPLAKEQRKDNFNTDYSRLMAYFLQPSDDVTKVMEEIISGPFKNADEGSNLLHKVAIVMRTGIGEYNQFLSEGDERNFVTCFRNYAKNFQESQLNEKIKHVKFAVFVTSDNTETKNGAVDALKSFDRSELDVHVVTLDDSAIHVMHMTQQDSGQDDVRRKLWKTIAEFFLIGQCDARFLTHGSLFGRVAAERGGGLEENNFFLSDSNCDGKREKYSYLECHEPKYPPVCGLS